MDFGFAGFLGVKVSAGVWDLVLLDFDFIVLAPRIGIWSLKLEI